MRQKKTFLILILILCVGALLRFYKLDWGEGLFTHPDEYHIAASVNQLSFPDQMHPHFFSYGTVTIYLIYFTQELLNSILKTFNFQLSTFNSFLIGRFYSALFSTLTIVVVYGISRTFLGTRFSLLAALLTALIPGLIQQAHFATPESALTFFLFLSLLLVIKFLKHKIFYLILASISLGLALGVKVSSIVFLLPLISAIALLFRATRSRVEESHTSATIETDPSMRSLSSDGSLGRDDKENSFFKHTLKTLLKIIGFTIASVIVTVTTFVTVAPYVFLDYSAFRSNLDYEGGLAVGKIPVFYTRQFIHTLPIIFQTEKILPYALGPFLFLFSSVGLIFLAINFIRKPKIELIMLVLAFLSLFIPNAFLFAKWTRFIAPTFPFFSIFAAISLQTLANKTRRSVYYFLGGVLIFGTVLWTMSFFSIYTNEDIRITASRWIASTALPGSTFLVEGGNMIDLPLSGNFQRTSLSFYDLEDDPLTREKIINALQSSDYFLIQSRRVFYNHQRLRHIYPKTAHFYDVLFKGKMGFEQIKEFHSYPTLEVGGLRLEVADERAEETWSVFDHPVIRVFKKNKQLLQDQYRHIIDGGKL